MTRREFCIALVIALWAGPRAVVELIERQRRHALIVAQLRIQAQEAIDACARQMHRDIWGSPVGIAEALYSTSLHTLHTSIAPAWGIGGRS